ncbi:hypothetical protein NCS52_00443200 [Fusarium sp. LHS14.1]|nr:hypothetical protein NCS52_00443200 [Fusarium sp. LHS14.1]
MAGSDSSGDAIFKLYRYDPSMAAAVIFIVLFIAITGLHGYQLIVTKTWFFTCFVIGGFMQIIGYVGRAVSSTESPNWTVKPYIVQTLLLLISPALFAASIYMILGRIILVTDGESCSPIRRIWLTKFFRYLLVLYIVAGLIMVRSLFRLIEYAQGNSGYLISHEAYLYIFDSVLMFLTMILFAWEHPSQLNAKLQGGGTAVRRGIQLYWEK